MSDRTLSRLMAAAVAALAALLPVAATSAQDYPDAVARIKVYAVDEQGQTTFIEQGSGFLVNDIGTILTSKHVIEAKVDQFPLSQKRRYVVDFGSGSVDFTAQKMDCASNAADVCIIALRKADMRYTKIAGYYHVLCRLPEVRDEITTHGYPPGEFATLITDDGKVTGESVQNYLNPSNIGITPGMSGGPVVWNGYVVAMNQGALTIGGQVTENLTYVQPLYRARSLLADAGVDCPLTVPEGSADPIIEDTPTGNVAARFRGAVVQVRELAPSGRFAYTGFHIGDSDVIVVPLSYPSDTGRYEVTLPAGGGVASGELAGCDDMTGICVLRVNLDQPLSLGPMLGCDNLEPGTKLEALGWPLFRDTPVTMQGETKLDLGNDGLLATTFVLPEDMAGAPVLKGERVVGIVSARTGNNGAGIVRVTGSIQQLLANHYISCAGN